RGHSGPRLDQRCAVGSWQRCHSHDRGGGKCGGCHGAHTQIAIPSGLSRSCSRPTPYRCRWTGRVRPQIEISTEGSLAPHDESPVTRIAEAIWDAAPSGRFDLCSVGESLDGEVPRNGFCGTDSVPVSHGVDASSKELPVSSRRVACEK